MMKSIAGEKIMSKIDNENESPDDCVVINFPGGPMHETIPAPLIPAPPNVPTKAFGALDFPVLLAGPAKPKPRPSRNGGKAKTLTIAELQRFLMFIQTTRHSPEADIVKVLLSFLAGLRACEIAGLHISDVTNADGSTADVIQVRPNVTKGGRGREVPICPELRQAIDEFRARHPEAEWLAMSLTHRTLKHQNAGTIAVWFRNMFKAAGLEGCSSHSGRRSFITWMCRNLPKGSSLRDVQVAVGHARLDTTQGYIDCSPNIRSVVNNLGAAFSRNIGETAE
jgi:integrase/recombinase XerD